MSLRLEAAEAKAAVSTKEGKKGTVRGGSERLEPRDLVTWTVLLMFQFHVRNTALTD